MNNYKLDPSNINILIVDDTLPNLRLLSNILKESGYKIRGVPSGTMALKAARLSPPDLILLDIMMPDINGFQVCQKLKELEQTRDIPVIFISALDEILDKVKAFSVGGVDYITKPFQVEEVLARVETHLTLRNLQFQLENKLETLQILTARFQKELALAQNIQYGLLPKPKPNWPELDIMCYTMPARTIGGDFYNYHAFENGKMALIIGDVSGKGVSAALLMATTLAQLDAAFKEDFTPAQRLTYLDKAITPYTKPHSQNCAMCYVEITPSTPNKKTEVQIVNAGCIPPYIKYKNGLVEWPELGGFALGQDLVTTENYTQATFKLSKGDILILTSDGVAEAQNKKGNLLGFDQLLQTIETGPQSSANAMLEHLKQAIFSFTDKTELYDDLTIVVAQI